MQQTKQSPNDPPWKGAKSTTTSNPSQYTSILTHPQTNKPYKHDKLYTDTCDYTVDGILVQVGDDNVERVIQYVSHQLDPTQKRWATIEKETYAIVYCLQKLRSHLWGSKFTILTDHKPLRSLFQNDMANTKIQRWAVLIAESGGGGVFNTSLPQINPVEAKNYITWSLPLDFDGIDRDQLIKAQREAFPVEWQAAWEPL